MDIGDNINPELKNNVTKPFISDLRRTKQMVVSGACGREMLYIITGLVDILNGFFLTMLHQFVKTNIMYW